jgi:putative sigma-54 modulation protein
MQINFTGHDIEITDALRNLIKKKFSRTEKHFNHNITSANVILSVQKLNNIAEMNIHIAGAEINARAEAADMYKSIDQMMNKLDRQINKHKERMTDHRE